MTVRDDIKQQMSMMLAMDVQTKWGFAIRAWIHYQIAKIINEFDPIVTALKTSALVQERKGGDS